MWTIAYLLALLPSNEQKKIWKKLKSDSTTEGGIEHYPKSMDFALMVVGNERDVPINMLGIIKMTFMSSWETKPDVIICFCPLLVSQEQSIGRDSGSV